MPRILFGSARQTRLVAMALMLWASGAARADVISTFDSDLDGWMLFQNAPPDFEWIAAGGNPDGHLGATDNTSDWGYVQAPPKFLTPAQYDGTFSFDLKVESLEQPTGFPGIFNVRVGLQGGGLTLINEGALPTLDWVNYSFTLNESSGAGWRKFSDLSQNYSGLAPLATQAEMQAVLAGLTRIVIATDYTLASTDSNVPEVDRTYIDNVRLSTPPVPRRASAALLSPASLALLGTGLSCLGILRLRCRLTCG